MIARSLAILPITPLADATGKEGYFILPTGALVSSATAAVPLGCITEGLPTSMKTSVAIHNFPGTVKVKLGATPGSVIAGSYLVLQSDGSTKLDPGTGARIRVARSLEPGVGQELVESVLIDPVILA